MFGDTVNVAARLQGLAGPGAIVLSASVYEQVRDKLALPFRAQGPRTLKNIDRPIQTYCLTRRRCRSGGPAVAGRAVDRAGGRWRWRRRLARRLALGGGAAYLVDRGARRLDEAVAASTVNRPTAASRSPSWSSPTRAATPAQDYFSDGLTEDITRALGRFKELTVIAYGAVLPFRGKELPLPEIGRALKARYLVSGSVRRMGSRVRVTVQLSDAANSTQLWSDQYDDELSDIFAVQDRIARRVAGTLASSLQQIALQRSLRKPTDNLDAYDLVLRARALAADATRAANRSARELLERATQMAPNYADAYAELADIYFQRAAFGWSEFAQLDVETAIRLAQKAIDLDEECVHGPQRAGPRLYLDPRSTISGLAESERALQINPSDAEVLLARAAVLLWTGRIDESIAAAELAMRLNVNIGPEAALNLGLAYLLARRYDRRGQAARGGARALSGLSVARFSARRRLCRARPHGRRARTPPSGASARTRTSTWRASARASRTRRCNTGSRTSLRKAGLTRTGIRVRNRLYCGLGLRPSLLVTGLLR